ncbi:MAG: ABC transporter substrate-binding protein [Halobacteriaceae archaeon]
MRYRLLVTLLILLTACTPTGNVVKEDPLHVGVISSLSGRSADYGNAMLQGLRIAQAEIEGDVELIVKDGKCKSRVASTAAKHLLYVHEVDILLTGCSSETLAVAPIANRSDTLIMATYSTSPAVSNAGDHVFRTAPSDKDGMARFAETVLSLNNDSLVILSQAKSYPQGLKKSFAKSYTRHGGEIHKTASFRARGDLRSQVTKLVHEDADGFMLFVQSAKTGAQALKVLHDLAVDKTIFGNMLFTGTNIVRERPELADGVITNSIALNNLNPTLQQLKEEYRKRTDAAPPDWFFVASAYDALHIINDAFRATNGSTDAVSRYLQSRSWRGAAGRLTFDGQGNPQYRYETQIVRNGTPVLLR